MLIRSSIVAFSDGLTVMIAVGLTASVVTGLSVYSFFFATTDFTWKGGLLFSGSFSVVGASIFLVFLPVKWVAILISTTLVFGLSAYIIYDTQLILGKREYSYSLDDYILASMHLYFDIMKMFLLILKNLKRR